MEGKHGRNRDVTDRYRSPFKRSITQTTGSLEKLAKQTVEILRLAPSQYFSWMIAKQPVDTSIRRFLLLESDIGLDIPLLRNTDLSKVELLLPSYAFSMILQEPSPTECSTSCINLQQCSHLAVASFTSNFLCTLLRPVCGRIFPPLNLAPFWDRHYVPRNFCERPYYISPPIRQSNSLRSRSSQPF